jgi:phosphoribosylformimino-5-aminoimidazole carboxamide ribotide isomerase
MLEGPSFDLYKKNYRPMRCHYERVEKLAEAQGIKLIAQVEFHFDEPQISRLGCEGTIIGKAIYEEELV